jgi:hypothetical protein
MELRARVCPVRTHERGLSSQHWSSARTEARLSGMDHLSFDPGAANGIQNTGYERMS